MTLPKNRLTTNGAARAARNVYRETVRPRLWDAGGELRRLRRPYRGNEPSFLIVGVQKAGTTGLFDALVDDRRCGMPKRKEIHFFDAHASKDKRWYFGHFWGDPSLVWGEATPEYFDTPGVPALIRRMLPDAKIIITLRDPVKRAISHYHHARDFGYEKRSLRDAVADARREIFTGTVSAPLARSYVRRSMYSESLHVWLDLYPRDQISIVLAERPDEALRCARRAIGLENASRGAAQLDARPGGSSPRSANVRTYPPPSADIVQEIRELLDDDKRNVARLVGWESVPQEWVA